MHRVIHVHLFHDHSCSVWILPQHCVMMHCHHVSLRVLIVTFELRSLRPVVHAVPVEVVLLEVIIEVTLGGERTTTSLSCAMIGLFASVQSQVRL